MKELEHKIEIIVNILNRNKYKYRNIAIFNF